MFKVQRLILIYKFIVLKIIIKYKLLNFKVLNYSYFKNENKLYKILPH